MEMKNTVVKNVSKKNIILSDLSPEGCRIAPEQVVDLAYFGSKEKIELSKDLVYFLKNGYLVVFEADLPKESSAPAPQKTKKSEASDKAISTEMQRVLSDIPNLTTITRLEDYVTDTKNPEILVAAIKRLVVLGVYEDARRDAELGVKRLVELKVCATENEAIKYIEDLIEKVEKEMLTK
jgi:hypothetical protein